jgi:hypothetical protein
MPVDAVDGAGSQSAPSRRLALLVVKVGKMNVYLFFLIRRGDRLPYHIVAAGTVSCKHEGINRAARRVGGCPEVDRDR